MRKKAVQKTAQHEARAQYAIFLKIRNFQDHKAVNWLSLS